MYDIYYGDELCGRAQIVKEGLYYLLECRCKTPDQEAYKIVVKNGANTLDLGICVPYSTGFGLRKRIPAKEIDRAGLSFRMVPAREPRTGKWVLLKNDRPFPYLDQLEKAALCSKEDGMYVFIPDL